MDNVNEKWSGDTEIKSTGKWADKTIAELKKARSALKDKENRTKEETSKLRQINFAIRSKKDWKGGVDESQIDEHIKGGLDSYYQLTKAKELAKADGHDYDKLPEYHRGADQPHKEKYMALAKDDVSEADGSGSYGGQSPLTYDTQRSSKMEDDDELNEIKKLSGLGEAKRKERTDVEDDWDDEDEDEKVEDPDKDKVQHILMQVKHAIDVDGDYPIKFADGTKHNFPINDLEDFLTMYMGLRPLDREKLQQVAIMSKQQFDKILSFFKPDHPLHHKSIYEK
jgi:hypothetical protein